MKIQKLNFILFLLLMGWMTSCDSNPRVIEAEEVNAEVTTTRSPIVKEVSHNHSPEQPNSEAHEVKVEEVLNTEKYSYLKVVEKGEEYWIAISKTEVEVGDIYFYRGGLMKKNFFSREFNRVFETVYLVSNFWKKNSETKMKEMAKSIPSGHSLPDLKLEKIKPAEGAISLQELFSNKPMYDDTTVKITGKIVKVNPKIMNRNWVHIQDGSGEGLDLTITTQEEVPLGAVVSLEGNIALEKDFGAGYRYEIIMEDAVLK